MTKNDKKWQKRQNLQTITKHYKIDKTDKKDKNYINDINDINDKNDKNDKMTNKQRDIQIKRQRDRETERVAQQLNIFLYQASIISSLWIISFINARYNRMYLETHLS